MTRTPHRLQATRVAVLLVAASTASLFSGSVRADQPADAVSKARLMEAMVRGDTGVVVATFERYPGSTLPFIDSYLEGGLAIIEKTPEKRDDALRSFQSAIKFAKLADEAFGGSAFSAYAQAFASWSPTEQKLFREGQRLYRAGMKAMKDDPRAAIEPLERSHSVASALGDTWGQGMALAGLAQAYSRLASQSGASSESKGDKSVEGKTSSKSEPASPAKTAADSDATESRRAALRYATIAAEINGLVKLTEDQLQMQLLMASMNDATVAAQHLAAALGVVEADPSIATTTRVAVANQYADAVDALAKSGTTVAPSLPSSEYARSRAKRWTELAALIKQLEGPAETPATAAPPAPAAPSASP